PEPLLSLTMPGEVVPSPQFQTAVWVVLVMASVNEALVVMVVLMATGASGAVIGPTLGMLTSRLNSGVSLGVRFVPTSLVAVPDGRVWPAGRTGSPVTWKFAMPVVGSVVTFPALRNVWPSP